MGEPDCDKQPSSKVSPEQLTKSQSKMSFAA